MADLRNAAVLKAKSALYRLFRVLPLRDRVTFMSFRGRSYGDNARAVLEALHALSPRTELLWFRDPAADYDLPEYVRAVDAKDPVRRAKALATSRVVLNTHRYEREIAKRKGQLFIETWHGGLGIKKIEGDVPEVLTHAWEVGEIENTARLCGLFISNSLHLTEIFRRAMGYRGLVWRCGYPKNDVLHADPERARLAVRGAFGLGADVKLLLYAPTFRDSVWNGSGGTELFDIGFEAVLGALEKRFGGDWRILMRLHPVMRKEAEKLTLPEGVCDATAYPDMQQLILGSDALLSDYSSCLFDAAEAGLPCFTFVPDKEEYASAHGVYYTPEALPFPYAVTREGIVSNILGFDEADFASARDAFFARTGLVPSDHAAKDVAGVIVNWLTEGKLPEGIENDDA